MLPAVVVAAYAVLGSTATVNLVYPDPALTPGAWYADATKETVCEPGYTSRARHVTARTKRMVFARYKIPYHPSDYEVDHLVPLELGGSNDITNLWPQPLAEARQKDVAETCLHRAVCDGRMRLENARKVLAEDWYSAYLMCRRRRKR